MPGLEEEQPRRGPCKCHLMGCGNAAGMLVAEQQGRAEAKHIKIQI